MDKITLHEELALETSKQKIQEEEGKEFLLKYINGGIMNHIKELAKAPYVTTAEYHECKSCGDKAYRDLNDKHKELRKMLDKKGFEFVGAGTNRIVFGMEDDQRYVFKIADDWEGIRDNIAEADLSFIHELRPVIAKTVYTHENFVIVQERLNSIFKGASGKDDLLDYINPSNDLELGGYYDTIDLIRKHWLTSDISPTEFANWGVDDDGMLKTLDYAYLKSLDLVRIHQCPRRDCDGDMEYTSDEKMLECALCSCKRTPSQMLESMDGLSEMEDFSGSTVWDNRSVISVMGDDSPTETCGEWNEYTDSNINELDMEDLQATADANNMNVKEYLNAFGTPDDWDVYDKHNAIIQPPPEFFHIQVPIIVDIVRENEMSPIIPITPTLNEISTMAQYDDIYQGTADEYTNKPEEQLTQYESIADAYQIIDYSQYMINGDDEDDIFKY